jgi:hypothetical protein
VPSRSAARRRRLIALALAVLLIGAILAGYVYFASLYMQKVLGFSPVATGLALVPSTVTVVLVSTLGTRRLLARSSIRAVLLAGLACMGAGQLLLAQIGTGLAVLAAVIVALQLRSQSSRAEPAWEQPASGGPPPPVPPAESKLRKD